MKILTVEDDNMIREGISEYLSETEIEECEVLSITCARVR